MQLVCTSIKCSHYRQRENVDYRLTTGGNKGITLCLLFMEGFTIAVILLNSSTTIYYLLFTTSYYLFNSDSRDKRGLGVVDGTSVLMKFRDLYELEKYLKVAYLEYRARQQA